MTRERDEALPSLSYDLTPYLSPPLFYMTLKSFQSMNNHILKKKVGISWSCKSSPNVSVKAFTFIWWAIFKCWDSANSASWTITSLMVVFKSSQHHLPQHRLVNEMKLQDPKLQQCHELHLQMGVGFPNYVSSYEQINHATCLKIEKSKKSKF